MASILCRASCSRSALSSRGPSMSMSIASPSSSSLASSSLRRLRLTLPTPTSRSLLSQQSLTTSSRRYRPTSTPDTYRSTPAGPDVLNELVSPLGPPPPLPPSILDKVLPRWAEGAKPYLLLTRIDKPIGSILLFWPCAWSITMASAVNHLPITTPAFYLSLFALGAVIMRGAGCTINDMWDRKYDLAVERTRNRPLARGDVSQFGALTFLGGQLALGLGVLTQLNWYSILLGASSLGVVVVYPLMKRITYYPQIVMGIAFNWGAMLGWSAVTGAVDWTIVTPMFVGGVTWGMMYDIIYAHQDKKDDILVGVKSMALRFPDNSRTVISVLSTSFISSLTLAGYLAGMGPLYYLISCGGGAAHLAWQCKTVDFDSRPDCWSKFCSNGWLGLLIWIGIAGDYVVRVVIPGDVVDQDQESGEEKNAQAMSMQIEA